MLNNFIYTKQKALFIAQLEAGNILDEAIVFIEDTKEIWNHGTYFDCSSVDLSNIEASIQDILNNKQDNISDLDQIRSGASKGATSAQQFYNQTTLSKEGWYRIGLLTAVMSTSSARIVVGGTNADVSPIIMDFQHNFRGDMLSQMPTVMTPLYITKVRAVKKTSDDVYVDLYFTNISSSLTTVSVFPLEGTWEPMNFVDVTASAGGTVSTEIDIVQDGFLDWKVDKVEGKGLSTEDFTTTLKTKLEELNDYDDTELSNAISTLRNDFNTLVNADASEAINTFNEIIAFLEGIKHTENLDNIIASIEQQIASKQDEITDLATIRSGASAGATAVQPSSLHKVATSGSYNDLSDKPTIPSAVTESTVSGWGFTKNTGTYSKPSTGIPKTDLASAVQTSLGKADTALQSIPSEYITETELTAKGYTTNIGTITGIKMNGASKGTSGVVDLGTVITAHQDISGKLDASVAATTYATKAEIPQDYLTEENVNEYIYAPIINHGTSDSSFALTANEYHVWGTMASLTLTLATPEDATIYNEYMFEFTSGSTATTLSLPSTIQWTIAPSIEANKTYQVSIVNNLGVIAGFAAI